MHMDVLTSMLQHGCCELNRRSLACFLLSFNKIEGLA